VTPKIVRVLNEQGRKQIWLAGKLNLPQPRLSEFIHVKRRPPEFFYGRVADVLNVPINDVLPEPAEQAA